VRVLNARNVHEALPLGMDLLRREGVRRSSRNGDVLMIPGGVTTVYSHPMERVEFHEWRDSNPFFHFFESLWMLAGRRDIKPLTRYVKRMAEYSDDGVTQNAAYGHRWRAAPSYAGHQVPYDQLSIIVRLLRENPETRQAVLQIWDHRADLGTNTKDHACNVAATFQTDADGRLDMVVFCRSNDMIYGGYGANAVHFSVLHEYVARHAGLVQGSYSQISVNYHVYVDVFERMYEKMQAARSTSAINFVPVYYTGGGSIVGEITPHPLVTPGVSQTQWDKDVRRFATEDGRLPREVHYKDRFFNEVAWPIVQAHDIYRDYGHLGGARFINAREALVRCEASDWRLACMQWLERREAAWRRAQDDGPTGQEAT
jgi:thymidylate synthase